MNQARINKKCVFVIGPEGSGSKLTARICAHVLEVSSFDDWGGGGWCDRGKHKVCHRSLPFGVKQQYPDIDAWIAQNEKDYELYFILTSRDVTISELSRINRFWARPIVVFPQQTENAREIMQSVMDGDQKFLIWSYETLMFLKKGYLRSLYDFLGVESEFVPELVDANVHKVKQPRKLRRFLARKLNQTRRRFRRLGRSSW